MGAPYGHAYHSFIKSVSDALQMRSFSLRAVADVPHLIVEMSGW